MQIQPGRFTQVVLTVLGLGMLLFAVLLNHYHPRNSGVAAAGHGYINVLALDIRQPLATAGSSIVAESRPLTVSTAMAGNNHTSASTRPGKALLITEAAANPLQTPEDRCHKLDDQFFKQIKNTIDEGYQTYIANRQSSQNNDNYYRTYLKIIDSAYSTYKLQLTNQGCQPLQPRPAAQPV